MTRTTFFSLVAVGMIAAGCERHPASELEGEGSSAPAPGEADPRLPSSEVPSNPGGAAPVSPEDKKGATTGTDRTAPEQTRDGGKAPAFFPGNK